jgi:hypothetical protein
MLMLQSLQLKIANEAIVSQRRLVALVAVSID